MIMHRKRHEYFPNVIWRIFSTIEIARGVGVNHASKATSRGVAIPDIFVRKSEREREGSSGRNVGGTLHNVGGDSGELLAINQDSCSTPYGHEFCDVLNLISSWSR